MTGQKQVWSARTKKVCRPFRPEAQRICFRSGPVTRSTHLLCCFALILVVAGSAFAEPILGAKRNGSIYLKQSGPCPTGQRQVASVAARAASVIANLSNAESLGTGIAGAVQFGTLNNANGFPIESSAQSVFSSVCVARTLTVKRLAGPPPNTTVTLGPSKRQQLGCRLLDLRRFPDLHGDG